MDRYAVIGHPVQHSLSPVIHRLFAEQTGQQLHYGKLAAAPDAFAQVASEFFAGGGKGLNVTVPFKGAAAQWVNRCDEAAKAARAVNTIALESASTVGYNTDGPGLVADLKANLGWSLADKRLLILGAGGAVRGVIRPLLDCRPAELTVANRTVATARGLVEEVGGPDRRMGLRWCALDEAHGPYDVVINGTSAGLQGVGSLVSSSAVHGARCYDLLYAQPGARTAFCAWAGEQGAVEASDGLGMLVEQAALAFLIWRGVRPETAPVIDHLRRRT